MSRVEVVLSLAGGPTVLIEFGGLRLPMDPIFDPPGLDQEIVDNGR